MSRFLLCIGALFSLAACSTEPQTSYCEAVCDNAVACHEQEREVDGDALMADCLAATEAADEDCAKATNGELDAATAKLLTGCTDALAAEAGECDAYTGRIDDQKQGTAPAKCLSYSTDAQAIYDAARQATKETNEQMCERFADTFCGQLDTCIAESAGANYADISEALGFSAYESCRSKIEDQTTSCATDGLYAPEEDFTDANESRQAARECFPELSALSCDDMLSGQLPPVCGPAMADPSAYTGAIVDVGAEFIPAP